MQREQMEYDVVIVGAGPAGLAAAIRLRQKNPNLRVCLLEKGAEVGAHILSGAVIEPRALTTLFPDWQALQAPLHTKANYDEFLYLTATKAYHLPTPKPMRNTGNYIISLGALCRWLAKQAESLGVEIYPGFAATEILFNKQGEVIGVATNNLGIDKNGHPTARWQAGVEIMAKQTILAEGCRGSLSKFILQHFNLTGHCDPQTYGLGIKEVWEVDPALHQAGTVVHTIGWPLDNKTYGGTFIYHLENHQVAVGLVVGLDYTNPYLSPFDELQRFKQHPAIKPLFIKGQRIAYGARALNEGGWQSIPKLTFPGGLLIGDGAGFLNVPKIKGIHTAMESGIVAAETILQAAENNISDSELTIYQKNIQQSWLWPELRSVRNIRPAFQKGLWFGLCYAAIDTYLFRGHAPWTLKNHADYTCLKKAADCKEIIYLKPDNVISFDKMSSVYLTNVNHEENQPCHLKLTDPSLAISVNYQEYASPETRYCPAGVYEIVQDANNKPYLQINAQNCIHCKTCDIKDPRQNINWIPPEGGGGPNYSNM